MLATLMASESTCREDAINPRTHALGLFQVLATGSANPRHLTQAELLEPETNADLGAAHLARLLRLCGSFGGAVSLYHGHRKCSDWREDGQARKVVGILESLRRWLARHAARVS
jgi:soluble lytic murein transglycosylase-like protein